MHVYNLAIWVCFHQNLTCMFTLLFQSMNLPWFWAQCYIKSCFGALKFSWPSACHVFLKFLELLWFWCSIDSLLAPWFYKLAFETCCAMGLHVFSRNWAQEVEFWMVKSWIWALEFNLEIPDFCLLLEREMWRSSGEIELPVSCIDLQSAQAEECTLERRLESHARAGVKRPSSVNFEHPILLPFARAGDLPLERRPLLHVRSSG